MSGSPEHLAMPPAPWNSGALVAIAILSCVRDSHARHRASQPALRWPGSQAPASTCPPACLRSEGHTSELQSLMRRSYAVFCLKKKIKITHHMTQIKDQTKQYCSIV